MKRSPNSREIAKRLMVSLNSLPNDAKVKLFGLTAGDSAEPVTIEQFVQATRHPSKNRRTEKTVFITEPDEGPIDESRLSPKSRAEEMGESENKSGSQLPGRSQGQFNRFLPLAAWHPTSVTTFTLPIIQGDLTLEYTGIRCREETTVDQGTSSDEIYVITSVWAGGSVRTEKHPSDRNYYRSMDNGDNRNGPAAECWTGGASDLCLITTVFEQDSGNSDSWQDYLDTQDFIVRLAAFGEVLGGDPACQSAPDFVRMTLDAIEDVPEIDDYIASVGTTITSDELESFAAAAENAGRSGIPFDFMTYHVGDGAKYRVYFRVPD
jgi:hypothetical protein